MPLGRKTHLQSPNLRLYVGFNYRIQGQFFRFMAGSPAQQSRKVFKEGVRYIVGFTVVAAIL